MKKIILASKSPYRKELLQRLGTSFECQNSNVDEDILKSQIDDPIKLSVELSIAKAKSVQMDNPDAIIIGSDQICYFQGEMLGKTGSLDKSELLLQRLQGREHHLYTSYAIISGDALRTHTNKTTLKMRELSPEQIKKYLRDDNPIDCAGSYKLELKGISLFSEIRTDDSTAIVGLPLLKLGTDLNQMGIQVPANQGE